MIFNIQKKLGLVLAATFLTVFAFGFGPKAANAQATGISCIATTGITNWIAGLFGGGGDSSKVGVAEDKLRSKEFTLDRLASCAAKQMLHQMTAETVNWINSGFKGSPAFMTNPEGFFLDVADQATGEFISKNGPLAKLCSPWNIDIRLALLIEQAETSHNGVRKRRYECTLGKILRNAKNTNVNVNVSVAATDEDLDNFVKRGDFAVGGWDGFMELISVTGSNPFSSYLSAAGDKMVVANQKQAGIKADLTYGLGFLSWEECEDLSNENGEFDGMDSTGYRTDDASINMKPDGTWQRCTKKTPGSVVANMMSKQANIPADELALADNINAVVNALVNQMVTQIMNKGLSSLSKPKSGASFGSGSTLATYTTQLLGDAKGTSQTTAPVGPLMTQINKVYEDALGFLTDPNQHMQTARSCLVEALQNGVREPATAPNQPPTYRQLDAGTATTVEVYVSEIDKLMTEQFTPLFNQILSGKLAVANLPSPTDAQLNQELLTVQTNYYPKAQTLGGTVNEKANFYQQNCDAL